MTEKSMIMILKFLYNFFKLNVYCVTASIMQINSDPLSAHFKLQLVIHSDYMMMQDKALVLRFCKVSNDVIHEGIVYAYCVIW